MTAADNLEMWVQGYYQLGWTCLPLPAGKKFPPPAGSTGADGEDLSLHQVILSTEPGGNLGLRMPDGVVGIDVDSYGEKRGAQTVRETEMVWGRLPDTPRLTSRDDGVSGIRFFRVPAGTELRTPGPHVDIIRRSHRFAVAAPSVHPEGRPYRWLDASGSPCPPPAVADLPDLPAGWVGALGTAASASRGSSATWLDAIANAKRWWSELPSGLAECTSVRDAREEGLVAASRGGRTGTARHDLLGPVLKLCLMAESDSPCPGVREAVAVVGKAYCGLPDGGDHPDKFWHTVGTTLDRLGTEKPWECMHVTEEDLDAFTSLVADWDGTELPEEAGDNPYRIIDWSEFWTREKKPADWLVNGLLQRGQQMVLYSLPGVGKSLLAGEIAVLLSEGEELLGGPARQPMRVLYVDLENSEDDVHDRLTAWGFAGRPLPNLHYSLLGEWPALNTEAGGRALAKYVADHRIGVVVVDTTSRVVEGDVNSATAVADLWNKCQVRLKRAGVAVIRIDHAGKNADRGQLGSVMKSADQDVIWEMTGSAGDAVSLTCRKDRSGAIGTGSKLGLRRRKDPLRHVPVTAPAGAPPEGATSAGEAAATLDPDQFEAELQVVELLDRIHPGKRVGKVVARKALNDHGMKGPDNTRLQAICTERNRLL